MADEVIDGQFGAREPGRLDVRRQHAAGGVDGEDDVMTAPFDLLPTKSRLRLREGDAQQHQGCGKQHTLGHYTCMGNGPSEISPQMNGNELFQRRPLAGVVSARDPVETAHCDQRRQ